MIERIRFLVKNGTNQIIPWDSLKVKGFRFDNIIISPDVTSDRTSDLFQICIHCNVLHNWKRYRSDQINEKLNVIEYLPFAGVPKGKTALWNPAFDRFNKINCVIEEPIILYLSLDGKTDSKINFTGVLALEVEA